MANIILPAVPVLSEIDDSAKLLIEQAGEINRYPISDLDIGGGDVTIDLSGSSDTNGGNSINADTLGGKPASDYVLKDELILDSIGGSSLDDIKTYVNNQITNRVIHSGGKNLLKNTAKNQTYNGLTLTVNDDGSVTLNGTATNTTIFVIGYISVKANTNYICNSGNDLLRYSFRLEDGNTVVHDFSANNTYTPDSDNRYTVCIRIGNGATVNETSYPMVRLASETDDTYEPYYESLMEVHNKLSMELLWENASPSSSFAKDALVTFPAGYDLYMIRATGLYKRNIPTVFFKFGEDLWVNASFGDISQSAHRTFFAHSRGLLAGNGFTKNAVDDTCCIPLEVYGIKGVLA